MPEDGETAPTKPIERWHLEDVDTAHRDSPKTFHIPSLEERRSLDIGRRVRLHFMFDEPSGDGVLAERMWITITEKHGDDFQGFLENEPDYIRNLTRGSPVTFSAKHIAQILIPQAHPRWIDTTKKAVVSKRVFETRRVGFLYRQPPDDQHDSGWVIWAGGEDESFSNDAENFDFISLDHVLAVDESIAPLLKADVGVAYERHLNAKDFHRVEDWKPEE